MRLSLTPVLFFAGIPAVVCPQSASEVEPRFALVLGNSSYSQRGGPLKNPVNDAQAMARALSQLRFGVTLKVNATSSEMDQALRAFARQLSSGMVGVVYYAGHGVQIEGINYLLPIDYDRDGFEEGSVKRNSIRVDEDMLIPMEKSGARLTLIILDACRSNPYQVGRGRSVARGLAVMDPARGSAILFSAAAGQVASDNQAEENGMFTKHLLTTLREPGLGLAEISETLAERVFKATDGKQLPAYYTQVVGRFVFNPGARATAEAAGVSAGTPLITDLTAEPTSAAPGQIATLRASASDPNAEPLQYFWMASAGRIEGRGNTVAFVPSLDSAGSTVAITVAVRNSRGLEARREITIAVSVGKPRAPQTIVGKAVELVQGSIDITLIAESAGTSAESGLIDADLGLMGTVWQVTQVRGTFPGLPIDLVPEGRNCRIVAVVEPPSLSNKFLKVRIRVQPEDSRQPMGIQLRYQAHRGRKR